MGIPVLRGRLFNDADDRKGQLVSRLWETGRYSEEVTAPLLASPLQRVILK